MKMSVVSRADVFAALELFRYLPERSRVASEQPASVWQQPLSAVCSTIEVDVSAQSIHINLLFLIALKQQQNALTHALQGYLSALFPAQAVRVSVTWNIRAFFVADASPLLSASSNNTSSSNSSSSKIGAPLPSVKNVIAIASGKGGVGKSTTAVNLALALAAQGAQVGLLDADIYGPSQALLLGQKNTRAESKESGFLEAVDAFGLQTMSMAYLVAQDAAMVWRGPMASSALQQMLLQTRWRDLDYLLVDMPPGTGDIVLTLSQKIPLAGAVIVTTPQDVALLDVQKSIEMFRKVRVPLLGVVENMAAHTCSACGHVDPIFGVGGGVNVAQRNGLSLLGSVPLSRVIQMQSDAGQPIVLSDPHSVSAEIYHGMAERVALAVAVQQSVVLPALVVTDD